MHLSIDIVGMDEFRLRLMNTDTCHHKDQKG